MINLIPNEEKKKMARGFFLRLAVVFFVTMGAVALVAVTAILPAYFFSVTEKNIAFLRLENQQQAAVPSVDSDVLEMAKLIQNQLSLVEKYQSEKFLVSERVLNQVLIKKTPEIKITQLIYESDPVKGKSLIIRGDAPSREKLLIFKRLLEEDPHFASVELPLSTLAQSYNIKFTLNLKPL